jgi:hypothetical protein
MVFTFSLFHWVDVEEFLYTLPTCFYGKVPPIYENTFWNLFKIICSMIGRHYSVGYFIGTRDGRLSEFVSRITDGFSVVFYFSNWRIITLKILTERFFSKKQVISRIRKSLHFNSKPHGNKICWKSWAHIKKFLFDIQFLRQLL